MDVEPDIAKPANLVIEPASPRISSIHPKEDNEKDGRRCLTRREEEVLLINAVSYGLYCWHSKSPESKDYSTLPLRDLACRRARSLTRSGSYSCLNPRATPVMLVILREKLDMFPCHQEKEYGPGRTFRERHSPDDVNSDKMVNTNDQLDTIDFGSEDFNAGYRKLEKHRHKKSCGSKREWDDDDSGKDERKEGNKKEEKRLPKENHDGHTNRVSNSSDMERTESSRKGLRFSSHNLYLQLK